MQTQKILQIGNSVGVTIPQVIQRKYDIASGMEFFWDLQEEGPVLKPVKKSGKKKIDAKFAQMVDSFMQENKAVLAELAKK